jgi:hypothetical protein
MESIAQCFGENPRRRCPKIGVLRQKVQEATREQPEKHLWRITQHIIQKYEMNVRRADTVYKWAYETRFNKKYNSEADLMTDDDAPIFGGIFIADGRGNFREVAGVKEDALDQQNIRGESMRRAGITR